MHFSTFKKWLMHSTGYIRVLDTRVRIVAAPFKPAKLSPAALAAFRGGTGRTSSNEPVSG